MVLADQLMAAGDPHGELIAVQCALADAPPEAQAGLRQQEDALLRGALALERRGVQVLWRHGFVRSATILEDPVARLPGLLAHRAGRLIEELAIAADRDQLAAIGDILAARPMPSLLRSVVVGPASPQRTYVTRTDADWLAPLTALLPGLVALPGAHRTTAAFEAYLADYPEELVDTERGWLTQLAPELDLGAIRLVARAGRGESLARKHAALPAPVRALLAHDAATAGVVLRRARLDAPVTCAGLYAGLRALAPELEPARFAISWPSHVLEVAIADGAVTVRLGSPTSPNLDATYDYWACRLADEPDDDELRWLVVWSTLFFAEDVFVRARRNSSPDYEGNRARVAHLLDRVEALDDAVPRLWELRGELARELGDLDGAERSFLRARALGADVADFALALTAFAKHDDAAAGAHVARVLAATPQHTAAGVLAAHLTPRPAEARARLETVAAVVERRRLAMTPLQEHRLDLWMMLEPDLDALVETGRYRELIATIAPAIGHATARVGAAAYLFAWAERFSNRVDRPPRLELTPEQYTYGDRGPSPVRVAAERAQKAQKAEAATLARALFGAAAEVDPLAGLVHQRWAHSHRDDHDGGAATVALLDHALAVNPHHLEALYERAMRLDRRDPARAAELYERYVATLGRMAPFDGDVWWDRPTLLQYVCEAYHTMTCTILHGAAEWVGRRPGRPDEVAIVAAETALVRIEPPLRALIAAIGARFGVESHGIHQLELAKVLVALARDHHAEALAQLDGRQLCGDAQPLAMRAHCLRRLGRLEEAREAAQLACERSGRLLLWPALLDIACIDAVLGGDRDEILEHLGWVLIVWPEGAPELAAEPDLAALRELPRFQQLLAAAHGRPADALRSRFRSWVPRRRAQASTE